MPIVTESPRSLYWIIVVLTLTNVISLAVAWRLAMAPALVAQGSSYPAPGPPSEAPRPSGPQPSGPQQPARSVHDDLADSYATQRVLRGLMEVDLELSPSQASALVPLLREMQARWDAERRDMDATLAALRKVLTRQQWEALMAGRKQTVVGRELSHARYADQARPFVEQLIQAAVRVLNERERKDGDMEPRGPPAGDARGPGQGLGPDEVLVGWVQIHQGDDHAATPSQAKALRSTITGLADPCRREFRTRGDLLASLTPEQAGKLLEWMVQTQHKDWPDPVTPEQALKAMENVAAGATSSPPASPR